MRAATATLILCVSGLMALGMTMLYSTSMVEEGTHYLMLQSIWGCVGIVACVGAALIDYRWLKRFSLLLFPLAVILLLLVFVPGVGIYKNGSWRWIDLKIVSFQPSEFAKVALIIMLAWYGEKYQRHIREFWRGLVVPGCLSLAILVPIFLEPDRGTTILLSAVTVSMLLLAGVKWIFMIPPAMGAAAFIVFSLVNDPVRMARIQSWLHPELYKNDSGYQGWQAMIALGAGGPTGLGLGNGRQKLGFIPEQHTDFILAIIGEEMGLVATLAIVLGFVVFVLCGVYIAWHARDVFGMLLGAGITFLVGLQAFINIGVVTSTLPNKGLPLPFISYGGSSLLLMLACVGVLISIAIRGGSGREELELEDSDLRSPQFA